MPRKDRRPESQPDRNNAGEISEKATDPNIFDEQGSQGQTQGHFESGPEPGQQGKGPGNFTGMGVHSDRRP